MPYHMIEHLEHADTNHAIQVADRVWWVGHQQEDDIFQCHAYLIEQGDQSVLLDPGSVLTFRWTLRKIEEIIPFSHIRYFVCHHQDPDITSVLPLIDQIVGRDDAVLVTHWRTQMLVKHYGLRLPFWLVDAHDWKLSLADRCLEFIFTPYAHFPGAICTFDTASQVLFSSDLFGGLTPEFALVAQNEHYFEAMRPFHEHYMPSRDILGYALRAIERHPIGIIAPQHGSIIPPCLVRSMIDKLKALDCGLYLIAGNDTDIQRLSRLNQTLRDITQTMLIYRDFGDIADNLLRIAQRFLPVASLEFYARLDHQQVLHLSPLSRYRGVLAEPPATIARLLGVDRKQWSGINPGGLGDSMLARDGDDAPMLILPLFSPDKGTTQAVTLLRLTGSVVPSHDLEQVMEQLSVPLQVAVEREAIYRLLDLERQRTYEQSIRDPLTGLFNRTYMQEVVQRLCKIHDRGSSNPITVLLCDIDHFKHVNDTYGHNQGDRVLSQVAAEILKTIRASDIPIRLGGEEFAVFGVGKTKNPAAFAERLRSRIEGLRFDAPMADRKVTISIGVAIRQPQEALNDLLNRADMALYEAKKCGRNQVVMAPDPTSPATAKT